jgi:hypothetical protein
MDRNDPNSYIADVANNGERAMAELEPGHPDELQVMLTNWVNQANDPIGSLPPGVTPTEWAVRNFIESWRKPVRNSLDSIEESLHKALAALKVGDIAAAAFEIESARQTLGEDLRDELGLYDWNREGS